MLEAIAQNQQLRDGRRQLQLAGGYEILTAHAFYLPTPTCNCPALLLQPRAVVVLEAIALLAEAGIPEK